MTKAKKSNFEKNKKKSKCDKIQKLNLWQNLNCEKKKKLRDKKSNCDKIRNSNWNKIFKNLISF